MCTREPRPFDSDDAVVLAGVTKRFGSRVAVNNLSLKVRPGEICALIGANGGGKTTSLRLIAGLIPADEGAGAVLGRDLRAATRAVRHKVGYLAQRCTLYGALSVRENLRFRAAVFGAADPGSAAEKQIRAFGLTALGASRVADLSGGWSRRVELAAVMIHNPRLLLLDEPTTGLDAAARESIWLRLLAFAAQGTAIVFSTHDLGETQYCSQVVTLSTDWMPAGQAPTCAAHL